MAYFDVYTIFRKKYSLTIERMGALQKIRILHIKHFLQRKQPKIWIANANFHVIIVFNGVDNLENPMKNFVCGLRCPVGLRPC